MRITQSWCDFLSTVKQRGNNMFGSVRLSAWVCETYIVHHQPALCITGLRCATWCTG